MSENHQRGEGVKQVITSLTATPIVLILLIINTVALAGFAYSMHNISNAAERRDNILEKCIARVGQ